MWYILYCIDGEQLLQQSVIDYVITLCLIATTSNKRKRGRNTCKEFEWKRGRNTCKDFERKRALWIIPICIPPKTQGVVGPNASTFTTRVGNIIREYADFHHSLWTKVPENHKQMLKNCLLVSCIV